MKRINIVVEGTTEREFIEKVLYPYLRSINSEFSLFAISVETSIGHKGGALKFSRYEKRVVGLLKEKDKPIVTSLIDLYGLDADFPVYNESKKIDEVYKRVKFLENAVKEKIKEKVDVSRFLPYIQPHEFEALLFSDIKGFYILNDNIDKQELKEIENIIKEFPNPEEINDSPDKAPSKRLKRIIKKYDKVRYGTIIAEEIGIETIMSKCMHFKEWIEKLIEMSK